MDNLPETVRSLWVALVEDDHPDVVPVEPGVFDDVAPPHVLLDQGVDSFSYSVLKGLPIGQGHPLDFAVGHDDSHIHHQYELDAVPLVHHIGDRIRVPVRLVSLVGKHHVGYGVVPGFLGIWGPGISITDELVEFFNLPLRLKTVFVRVDRDGLSDLSQLGQRLVDGLLRVCLLIGRDVESIRPSSA